VFVVLDGELRTPGLDSGCLPGVTRALVCELAGSEPGGIREGPIPIGAIAEAGEAFLTSSTRDIHPVHVLDGHRLEAPGPRTARLREQWQAMLARTLDP
jgi:branched-chain amino acid aminotransferase